MDWSIWKLLGPCQRYQIEKSHTPEEDPQEFFPPQDDDFHGEDMEDAPVDFVSAEYPAQDQS